MLFAPAGKTHSYRITWFLLGKKKIFCNVFAIYVQEKQSKIIEENRVSHLWTNFKSCHKKHIELRNKAKKLRGQVIWVKGHPRII